MRSVGWVGWGSCNFSEGRRRLLWPGVNIAVVKIRSRRNGGCCDDVTCLYSPCTLQPPPARRRVCGAERGVARVAGGGSSVLHSPAIFLIIKRRTDG